jgi:hypothetical protein
MFLMQVVEKNKRRILGQIHLSYNTILEIIKHNLMTPHIVHAFPGSQTYYITDITTTTTTTT